MTLEQIRAALPTHIMLTPWVHRWREGDEQAFSTMDGQIYWDSPNHKNGDFVKKDGADDPTELEHSGRRPVPPHILDNQAFYLLLDKGFESRDHFADKAENLGIVRKLGGLDNYRAQTKAVRLYDKWLLEQIESGG